LGSLNFFVEDRWIKMLKSNTIAESNLCWPKAMPEAPPRVMEREKDNKGGSGSKIVDARETFGTLLEISKLLNTGLDSETLAICVRLCEQGANPEALATIIRELRRESNAIQQNSQQ